MSNWKVANLDKMEYLSPDSFGDGDKLNDVGNTQYGYYVEAAYNVFQSFDKIKSTLTPFVRYSNFDTQHKISEGIVKDEAYNVQVITAGLGWKIVPGVALKADIQFIKSKADSQSDKLFNAGVGIWF